MGVNDVGYNANGADADLILVSLFASDIHTLPIGFDNAKVSDHNLVFYNLVANDAVRPNDLFVRKV